LVNEEQQEAIEVSEFRQHLELWVSQCQLSICKDVESSSINAVWRG
jgi:hypothetical protein